MLVRVISLFFLFLCSLSHNQLGFVYEYSSTPDAHVSMLAFLTYSVLLVSYNDQVSSECILSIYSCAPYSHAVAVPFFVISCSVFL